MQPADLRCGARGRATGMGGAVRGAAVRPLYLFRLKYAPSTRLTLELTLLAYCTYRYRAAVNGQPQSSEGALRCAPVSFSRLTGAAVSVAVGTNGKRTTVDGMLTDREVTSSYS